MSGFLKGLIDVLFPPKCVFCRKLLKNGEKHICEKCRKELPYIKPPQAILNGNFFNVCISPLAYKDKVRESILRFKFRNAVNYAGCYGILLSDCIRQNLSDKYDLITWVPLSKERKKKRGYNQAELLAMAAALELDDVAVETMRKIADNSVQSNVGSIEKRRANVSGVYELTDAELIVGQRILIIDDIVTTGATLSECSRVLLMGGAESVCCAALAKSMK